MEDNLFNGRVNILSNARPTFDYISSDNTETDGYDIVSRTLEHTPVSALFFSKLNIEALHKGMCNLVYNKSRGKYNIDRQSDIELKIIMRSIYFNSLNKGNIQRYHASVVEQVKQLNTEVLDWAVADILTNISQFEKYKNDVSLLPMPIERPSLLTTAGSKTLELQSFV